MKALQTSVVTGRIHRTRQAIAAASLLGLGSVHAATFAVTSLTDNNPGSLREAITLANASTGVPDTIVFNTNGTIRLASRLPDITDDLTIDGSDAAVTLSGNRTVQLLFVGPGKRLEIKRLTLADGYCASPCSGGAILNVGKLKVTQSTFSGNSALLGGAIHNFGELEVAGCTFMGNSARFGGAIHNFDKAEVADSAFSGNAAAIAGGAIHNFDRLTAVRSRFSDNFAQSRGGGIDNAGTLHLSGNVLAGNMAAGHSNDISSEGDRNVVTIGAGEPRDAGSPIQESASALARTN